MKEESLLHQASIVHLLASGIIAIVGIYEAAFKSRTSNVDEMPMCKYTTNFNHPEKCMMDKLASSIFPLLIPLSDLAIHASSRMCDGDHDKTVKTITAKLNKIISKGFKDKLEEFSKLIQKNIPLDSLVSGDVYIPRDPDILSKFGIPDAENILRVSTKPQDSGAEIVTCPVSAIQGITFLEEPKDAKGKGAKAFKACKLKDISFTEKAHLVLWFHGGGLTLGSARDDFALTRALYLTKWQLRHNQDKSLAPPIIFMSVEYRLAPLNPFPSAIIDGLSASSFLAERCSTYSLHVAGCSAGGNLAAVVGLESHRKYPGKFKSIVVDIPMLEPTTATESHRLNSKSSGICPVDWVRWCWSAYLQLEELNGSRKRIDFSSEASMIDALDNSIWSKFMNSKAWRLVSPACDLPDLSNDEESPTIVVMTATADPLHDAGVDFFKRVEARSKKCVHIESKGSHVLSNIFDKPAAKRLTEEWSKLLLD